MMLQSVEEIADANPTVLQPERPVLQGSFWYSGW
jgi:hypothetical protein